MNTNSLLPSSHVQSNSIALHPTTQFDGLNTTTAYQHNQEGQYNSSSPSRGSKQGNQQFHIRGPNPLEPASQQALKSSVHKTYEPFNAEEQSHLNANNL